MTSLAPGAVIMNAILPGAHSVEGFISEPAEESEVDLSSDEDEDVEEQDEGVATVDLTNDVSAYIVEESLRQREPEERPTVATVIKTPFGIIIDGRRMMILGFIMLFLIALAMVLGSVLGTVSKSSSSTSTNEVICGPLCGTEEDLPFPDKEVFGDTCKLWDFNARKSANKTSDTYCDDTYLAVAHGCGCPSSTQVPTKGCGGLCQNGQKLPDPDREVTDINFERMTCQDWELKSLFDTDPEECPNYNAIGLLCGCQENQPHPDACGPLCIDGEMDPTNFKTQKELAVQVVWKQTCEEWGIMATYLPHWYLSPEESCNDYFRDVAFQCGCYNQEELPPSNCGALCQERSTCGLMCQDGSPIPDPDLVVRDMSCQEWDFFSRMATEDEEMCRFYEMIGHDCGCNSNVPPDNACGPLCGSGNSLPDPQKEIAGQTCQEWESTSTFLFEGYGLAMGSHASMIESCDDTFSKIAYGCGCPDIEPPSDGCGLLCQDGSPVPDPNLIVGDRTCGNLELSSLFETDQQKCGNYHTIVASQCGCKKKEETNTIHSDCLAKEDLYNQTFFKTVGMSQYSVDFGPNGRFVQIQNNKDINLLGRFRGFDFRGPSSGYEAVYGGGSPCGMYGPRRAAVSLVEDASVTEPTLTKILEPYICIYHAELSVPELCMS